MEFTSKGLQDAYNYAKSKGYKVFASDRDVKTSYIFIESDRGICYVQSFSPGVTVGTVHKPNPKVGIGFRVSHNIEGIEEAFGNPWWASIYESEIKKYANFEEYNSNNKILKYKEI